MANPFGDFKPCEHCGFAGIHSGVCPRIKAIEYYECGTVKRVEYHEPAPPVCIPVPAYPPIDMTPHSGSAGSAFTTGQTMDFNSFGSIDFTGVTVTGLGGNP